MIRNDSITVWRISAEINCYFVKRSRLDPIRNFPTKSVKPKAVNSNPRHEHKFSQCLHSCLGDVMSPSLSVRSSSPLPASRSNWQDESLSSTPNARTHDNCICFVYSWTLFVFDVGGDRADGWSGHGGGDAEGQWIYVLNIFHLFSFVCFVIYSINSKSGHDRSQTFYSISHISGQQLGFWGNFIMALHGFARSNSKNKVLRTTNHKIRSKTKNVKMKREHKKIF